MSNRLEGEDQMCPKLSLLNTIIIKFLYSQICPFIVISL